MISKNIASVFTFSGLFVLLMWFVYCVEVQADLDFGFLGVYPREVSGLIGIITSPFVHGDINHLISNSLPMFMLIAMVYFFYRPVFYKVMGYGWLITGFWVWVAARPSYHIGASGLIYMLAAFLFWSGFLRKSYRHMSVSLMIVFLYGSLIWGVFPFDWKISWESHLLGGVSGTMLGFYYRKVVVFRKKKYSWEVEDETEDIAKLEERFGERYWDPNRKIDSPETIINYIFKQKED